MVTTLWNTKFDLIAMWEQYYLISPEYLTGILKLQMTNIYMCIIFESHICELVGCNKK